MLIAGRTPSEYFLASRWFLAAILLLAAASVVARLTGSFSVLVQYLQLVAFPLIAWAGWHAVRRLGFSLSQAAIVGFVLSFGSHWTLLIFHGTAESLLLFVVNSTLFMAVALGGAILAKAVRFP